MSEDETPSDVLGGLPRTRPHRRSDKRPERPVAADRERAAEETASAARRVKRTVERARGENVGGEHAGGTEGPSAPGGSDLLGSAVQAAAELAEAGLSASARLVRAAVARLPRP